MRTPRRCRSVGDLAESRRAAADCLVLHHPVLLEDATVIDQVASAIEKVLHVFTLDRINRINRMKSEPL